jgi:hypothetical protein
METRMNLLRKLTSAHAIALIALFVALGSSAGAAGVELITGDDIRNGSVTGRDVRNHSLRGKDLHRSSIKARQLRTGSVRSAEVRNGTLRARDFNRIDLPGLTRSIVRAQNITNYSNFDPIVSYRARQAGDFLTLVRFSVANTGSADEFLGCGFRANGNQYPTAGADTRAGQTTRGFSVTVVEVDSPSRITFVCAGSGGTTYDIRNVRLRVFRL